VSNQGEDARKREGELLPGGIKLQKLIAVGGMAALYEAESSTHGTVAVKLLHRHMLGARDIKERFVREGRLTMGLRHPGIPAVYALHELPDGSAAISMELLRGETVQQRIERKGYLSAQEVLAIADGMLGVLAFAHGRGIIHRDIKPENVFLTSKGELKLLDFGIARANDDSSANLTRAGSRLGTPAFMSPEQARGSWVSVDIRTDLWAVGATMFAALAGTAPHEKPNLFESLDAAVNLPAPKIATVVPGLRPAVAHVIDRALEREPLERWQDAAAMRDAVREAWRSVSGDASMQRVWDHIASEVVVGEAKIWVRNSLSATEPEIPETPPQPAPPSADVFAPAPPAADVLAPKLPPKKRRSRRASRRWMIWVAAAIFLLGISILGGAIVATLAVAP
jgi:serine/threonine protein kinase